MAQISPVSLWCARRTRPKLPVPSTGPWMKSLMAQPSYLCLRSSAGLLGVAGALMWMGEGEYACKHSLYRSLCWPHHGVDVPI